MSSTEDKVLGETKKKKPTMFKENIKNLEMPETIKEEFLNRGYDKNTWSKIVEYYNDEGTFPSGSSKQQVDKIESRLYQIYPEQYFLGEFENESVNEIYSITRSMRGHPDGQKLPFSFHTEMPDLEDLEAIVIDHGIIRSIIEKTDKIKLEDCEGLEKRLEPLKDTLDEVYEDLDVVRCGYLEDDVRDSVSKSTTVSWKKPLEFLDDVVSLRKQGKIDIDIRHPDDLQTRTMSYVVNYTNHNVSQEFEIIHSLEEISDGLPVSKYKMGQDDEAIVRTASEEYDKFMVLTYDSDFTDKLTYDTLWDLLEGEKPEFMEIEEENNCKAIPMLPSCAYSIFEPMVEEGYI